MSLLGDLAKGAIGAVGGGDKAGIANVVTQLLSPEHGGLDGLVKKFESAGMGDMIKGWISTGPNPAISADQLQKALGADTVSKLAASAGINSQDLLGQLSSHLPGLVDKLTPDGKAPSADMLQQGLGMLGGLLGKK